MPRHAASLVSTLSLLLLAYTPLAAQPAASPAQTGKVPAILQDLRSFATLGTVLHVAAHPDDENTQLITYFARGRGYRTAYLSLTRGDGGQNEIGPEFDEKLGVARTQELLAARRLDGGRQFFTRAIDFGYSKTPEETLTFWNRKEVLGDVVRIIRQFRPDVIVTRFPIPPGSGGHGHHTASGILAVEAFKLAGDASAYPEQLTQGLTVWQPKRVVWNGFGAGRGGGAALTGPTFRVDIGGSDPVTGEGFGSIASRSRAMHITQFGFPSGRGVGGGTGPSEQSFTLLGGEPAEKDLMDGIDTTWARVPGGAEIGPLAEKAMAGFKPDDPSASLPALLALRAKLAGLAPGDPVVDDKRSQLDRIVAACLGLSVSSLAERAEVVPGEDLAVQSTVTVTGKFPVRLIARGTDTLNVELRAGQPQRSATALKIPATTLLTQPYWLREEGSSGIARVDDPKLIGSPENAPAVTLNYKFGVGDQTLTITDVVMGTMKSAKGDKLRRVDVIPPVALRFAAGVSLFKPGTTREVLVDVAAARAGTTGSVQLEVPAAWKVSPAKQDFRLGAVGDTARVAFQVTAPAHATTGRVAAFAEVKGTRYSNQRVEIDYDHLPLQLLQPPARARLVSVAFEARGKNVGYLPGAGDATAEALEQLGYKVTMLTGADLVPEKLNGLDAVVVGVRAFNERRDLATNLPGLFAYVENGGTVVAQYNRPNGLAAEQLGPYRLSIAGPAPALRVTDEKSPVAFLASEHPAITTPNPLTMADFDGWFQERGAYFPSTWDTDRYTSILALSDMGEKPLTSGVLIAKHGKGYYVYTGLAFFRQLPAGVPGAYRLFANLVSLGK